MGNGMVKPEETGTGREEDGSVGRKIGEECREKRLHA